MNVPLIAPGPLCKLQNLAWLAQFHCLIFHKTQGMTSQCEAMIMSQNVSRTSDCEIWIFEANSFACWLKECTVQQCSNTSVSDAKGKVQNEKSEQVSLLGGWVGSFVLHVLVGFCWDKDQNRWDGSQLLPSQSPTNHPRDFVDSSSFLYQKET